jgi:hypothetical protein
MFESIAKLKIYQSYSSTALYRVASNNLFNGREILVKQKFDRLIQNQKNSAKQK